MKVGTDGVLLGAWVPVEKARKVLDIGCGSGLIALMIAQRSTSEVLIDGVELEPEAARQASSNAASSPGLSGFVSMSRTCTSLLKTTLINTI